uniref:ATP synthase protein 8 n=1 Tax=Jaminaea angkorensis TaxID=542766 RepID=V9N382_9BASI|nr:ATP synthase subunit 8 [Jaminaea angkorensis]AGJ71977.1 ATP synthase subunit 8 [Jaminaea angkorensis]
MPQSLPFYFVNQASFTFLFVFVTIYVMSRFILPAFVELFVVRMYITRLLPGGHASTQTNQKG